VKNKKDNLKDFSMHILHTEASQGWGGQEMRILKEAEGMRSRGHTVIFAIMKGGALIDRAKAAGFIVYPLNFKKIAWIFCLLSLIQIVHRHKIDLINTHSSLDGWIGGIAGRISRRKVVRTRHLSTPIKPGINSRILYGKLADFVVTTCEAVVPLIAAQSGKPRHLLRSIPTGVDPQKITVDQENHFRKNLGVKDTDFLIGTACVMRSWKGINVLLDAAKRLRDVPDLRWVIIGGGHAEIHHQRAKELKLEGIVYFTGHLDTPYTAMKALDCFTLLSTAHEGVSQAILQAAYLKKPLIATPTGGLGEVCIPDKTGIQVPVFDSEAVANAVIFLKENPILRKKFGDEAHQLVLERFTLNKTLEQMEEVYEMRS
jgi:glycosyltransferase involved in cell wall biosynthesis